MTSAGVGHGCGRHGGYRHEAFLYEGDDVFLARVVPFIRDAGAANEPILVVLPEPTLAVTREALGADADAVLFADMDEVGDNPARIIPAWQRFLCEHAGEGRSVRGIGEPISAARSQAELAECERHEALLNVAFEGSDFWLLCPYDTGSLEPAVIDAARRNHPFLSGAGWSGASESFPGATALSGPFDAPLSRRAGRRAGARHRAGDRPARGARAVARHAADAGLVEERRADLVLAVGELVTNSLLHGGGSGTIVSGASRTPWSARCAIAGDSRIRWPDASSRPSRRAEGAACGWPTRSAIWCRCAASRRATRSGCAGASPERSPAAGLLLRR